eukprot:6200887-Pleurochrysis_carterae.AAC.6
MPRSLSELNALKARARRKRDDQPLQNKTRCGLPDATRQEVPCAAPSVTSWRCDALLHTTAAPESACTSLRSCWLVSNAQLRQARGVKSVSPFRICMVVAGGRAGCFHGSSSSRTLVRSRAILLKELWLTAEITPCEVLLDLPHHAHSVHGRATRITSLAIHLCPDGSVPQLGIQARGIKLLAFVSSGTTNLKMSLASHRRPNSVGAAVHTGCPAQNWTKHAVQVQMKEMQHLREQAKKATGKNKAAADKGAGDNYVGQVFSSKLPVMKLFTPPAPTSPLAQ